MEICHLVPAANTIAFMQRKPQQFQPQFPMNMNGMTISRPEDWDLSLFENSGEDDESKASSLYQLKQHQQLQQQLQQQANLI